jgi:hypothetical protein
MIEKIREVLGRSQAVVSMKGADDKELQWFEACMRHYAWLAREELERRGVRPLTFVGRVEVIDRREPGGK